MADRDRRLYRLAWIMLALMLIVGWRVIVFGDIDPVISSGTIAVVAGAIVLVYVVVEYVTFLLTIKRKKLPPGRNVAPLLALAFPGSASVIGLFGAILTGLVWVFFVAVAIGVASMIGPTSLWRRNSRGNQLTALIR